MLTRMAEHIGRPQREETVAYYHKYIDLVPDGDIRETLRQQHQSTVDFLETIPESLAGHRYAAGKWSVAEVINHVNDGERLFTMRAFWFARGFESELPSYDQDTAAAVSRADERPWRTHVEEFASLRASTADFFGNLPKDAWLRRGVASGFPFTVRGLAYITAGHVSHHLQVLKQHYL
jgi:hypothetical protein